MLSKDSLAPVLERVDLLIAELRHLRLVGPHFLVTHRFRMPGTDCLAGEEIASVSFINRGNEYPLRLSLALRILFDFLARHSRLPQSARQIELGIRSDDFYKRHATNVTGRVTFTRRIPRSAVRVYVRRLHLALSRGFQDAGVQIDPGTVLISQKTVGNEVGYQLKATCDWTHVDLTSRNVLPLR